MATLLSKEHPITEKGLMEFRPFGTEPDGTLIRDLSGIIIRACVENLEACVGRARGEEAGRRAVEELVRRLNERIPLQAYRITSDVLRNPWNSYSLEFSAFLAQFCVDISGDPHFHFTMVKDKGIPPIIQVLGRPFSLPQIYKMSLYFSQRYTTKDTYYVEAVSVSDRSATARMIFAKRAYQQFGPYLKACAQHWCDGTKAYFVAAPEKFHNLPPAIVTDRRCIAEGDDYCEWDLTWTAHNQKKRPAEVDAFARLETVRKGGEPRAAVTLRAQATSPVTGGESLPPVQGRSPDQTTLLSNEHRITEKGRMEFQPFGIEPDRTPIRDLSGVVIRADVEYMEDYVSRTKGRDEARLAIEELVRRLNERIPDPAYHVTEKFLRNPWNSYSSEFSAFCAELCIAISGDPRFLFNMAREKAISPIIQTLGKPFSAAQIYKMSAYFAQRYAKDSFFTEAVEVLEDTAIVQMRLSARTYRQFGPYRRACAEHWCNAHKGYFSGVPEIFHGLAAATVTDRRCIAHGDEYCEWGITWSVKERSAWATTGRPAPQTSPEQRRQGPSIGTEACSGAERGDAGEAAERQRRPRPLRGRTEPVTTFLSKDHPITEKGLMEFQPFGVDSDGTAIRDLTGVTIRACVDYLEEHVGQTHGPAGGKRAVEQLVQQLNDHIPDPGYHVSVDFLKNTWNSYSYEFSAFLNQLCSKISGDPQFAFNMARRKAISSLIQVLGRPFSVPKIYKMSPYFAQLYAGKNGYSVEAVSVSDHSAILRMRLGERAYRHFGPYLKACALCWCHAHKGYLVAVPEKFHRLAPAIIMDRACIAEGDPHCEWEVAWSAKESSLRIRPVSVSLARRVLRREIEERERLIDEQLHTLDARHVELQESYVQQQQIMAERQRRVDQLTTLHEASVVFTSTLDRETLIQTVLETITQKLHYDRAMLTFFDPARRVVSNARVLGVSADIADFARTLEIPVTDPHSVEGMVLLQGKPLLVDDIQEVWDRLDPLNRRLAITTKASSIISVPLKIQNKVLGAITVDRTRPHSLTGDDLDLMVTLAGQVAIALHNADTYRQIEELNIGLEAKVRERTVELEAANEKLRELDLLKSAFVSIVSHELRTPMTSIKGYVENLLDGLGGALTEKQAHYLERVKHNAERLTRMTNELLDLSRIEAGRVELHLAPISVPELVSEVVESFQSIAREKAITIRQQQKEDLPVIQGDRDKLNQVLTNLVQNAIKFSPSNSEVLIELRTRDKKWLEVCVADHGCGIPPNELGKVFDKFYRGESVPIEAKGAGLGLPITKSLVELHGGTIWVTSAPGAGSRFYFTLPL